MDIDFTCDDIRNLRRGGEDCPLWTQAQAADIAGVNVSTWRRWESGRHQMPKKVFNEMREQAAIEDLAVMADASRFIVEAIISILPPSDAPIWADDAWWRVYGEEYDAGVALHDDCVWPSHPSCVIRRAMCADESADLSAVRNVPSASDPIWGGAWRTIENYAKLYDSASKIDIYGCWPPHPRYVIALGICYTQPTNLKQTINMIAKARAERWMIATPGREMPVMSGGRYDLWSILRDRHMFERELKSLIRACHITLRLSKTEGDLLYRRPPFSFTQKPEPIQRDNK
mgnify:CR=1 FL=1